MLVNNAGYGYMAAVEEGEDAEVRALFDTNYFGACRDDQGRCCPQMRARRRGHVINISSMTGLVANPPNVYYSSTKFALEALTEGLAKEVAPFGHQGHGDRAGRVPHRLGRPLDEGKPTRLEDYAETVGARKQLIADMDGKQPGDPERAAAAIVALAEWRIRRSTCCSATTCSRRPAEARRGERFDRRVGRGHARR